MKIHRHGEDLIILVNQRILFSGVTGLLGSPAFLADGYELDIANPTTRDAWSKRLI